MDNQIKASPLTNFAYLYTLFTASLFFTILGLFQVYFICNAVKHLNTILPIALFISFLVTNKIIKTPGQYKTWLAILAVFIICGIYSFLLFDKAGDGRGYHQDTIILIKNGWNPLLNSFFYNNLPPIDSTQSKTFAIADEILAACFAIFFGHIQIGKIINLLFALYCLCIVFIAQEKLFGLKFKSNLIISCYIALNPIVMSQLQSFYLDGNLFLCCTIFLFSLLMYLYKDEDKYFWLIIVSTSFAILANLKMTGLILGSIILFISFIVYCISHENKLPKSILFFGLISSLMLLSWHPYIQNLINGRNIFWPILGKNTLNVFKEVTNGADKPILFMLSYFSPYPMEAGSLFIPNLKPFVRTDTFIGALGPFFGIMLLISIYFIVKYFYHNIRQIKNNRITQILFIMLSVVLISVITNPAPWWAKYSPMIVLLPAIGFIIISLNHTKLCDKYSGILIFMIVVNSGLFYSGSLILTSYRSYKFTQMEHFCRISQCKFDITHQFTGSLKNQLEEDKVDINLTTDCSNKKIIWTDVLIQDMVPNRVCM